jgi:hypothetical protein
VQLLAFSHNYHNYYVLNVNMFLHDCDRATKCKCGIFFFINMQESI